ncbi:WD40/YVTN/BNR-like repeat-containing protein [Spiroplasma endosymbiont of Lariophagus distinguendus]|uniref:WD40/YVTN/BNR-like repeat-containing protein n=1 Tax=Spiroplasma endosymbiont of Lariophagus distinguendus TaxID=2935082 RepID=UPI00207AE3FB|nr:hypothetical protein [Spiroplasma endosymbiont of Lariophagus distinguendus]
MKKLLTIITLSVLVGTSASNLKPLFTNNVINYSFKSNQVSNKDISIKNQNNTNPFDFYKINNTENITKVRIDINGIIWIGAYTGLYKSTDGNTFTAMSGVKGKIHSLAVDKDNNVYAGNNNGTVYKSTDGNTFTAMSGTPNEPIFSLAVDKNNNVYAVCNNDVYKSTDGNTFIPMSGTPKKSSISLAVDKNNNVYVGTYEGVVYKSTDGNTFTAMSGVKGWIHSLAVDKDNNVYAGNNNGTVYKSTDGNTFTAMSGTPNEPIFSLAVDKNNNVYAVCNNDVYKSTDGNTFTAIFKIEKDSITSLAVDKDNNVYVGTDKGLYITNPINLLLKIIKPDTFDKSWPLYKGIVYDSIQKIDIKEKLVANATLDGKSITIPTTDLDIPIGEHNLILTLKDKSFASVFGGDVTTGQVTYKLWVKTSIDKNKINYQTKIDDTELFTGLVSNVGNTKNADIIQTKIKDGTGRHNAIINIGLNDTLIDFDVNKSFYEQGTVDETTNDFKKTGSKQGVSKNLSIQNDGIYHLHLEDTVGNTYDSYLELGESNWKLKGTFDDSELNNLKSKLNVTVNLTDPSEKSKALGWLHQYENFVENKFNETIKTNGKGFDSFIKNQITSYTSFLKPLTYDITNEPKFDDGLDKDLLVKTINDKANELLNKGLDILPKNLNVNTSNVVNKSTLTSYTNWINNYQDFINKNKDKWINDISNIASRGFATDVQENKIKAKVSQFLNNDNIKNYLKSIIWEDNKLLKAISSDYQQYVKLDELQKDTIDWVNSNESTKDIVEKYQQAIKNAESGLNLHGYSIDKILNGKPKPQTKKEIDNFAAGQSYHDWLQTQANIKFRGWQFAIGFGIAIPLLLVILVIGCFIYRRTNPKYHGYWRGKKEDKKDDKLLIKSIKSPKKENKK